ncbi:taurine--2-oxoglutarate transaminase [Prauserella sediminis]|uniref:Taurine--2-oxoglutarate transaminase n=1 Tax=Prauserella sediminis TaxID=577680 RepID=A0A839XTY7_9PSEU|nr:aspartate aminotransferase family protein [Prauserella sediminis]MBB3664498.1 taurine--2-oxoglutarate transaminase [Prauserella sediminis]
MNHEFSTVGQRVRDDDRRHVFHSWSAQGHIDPIPVAGASGSWFWDYDDNQYLDFSSQLVNQNLGHSHPRLVRALQEQAEQLAYIAPSFAAEPRSTAARMIAERAPTGLDQVFFTNGGADANEHAVRMARLYTGRHKVLSTYRSYHGATTGAVTLTGDPRRWSNEPGMPGVVHFFGPYLYRSAFGADNETDECRLALQHLEQVITLEGSDTVAAVLLESVVGTNGVLVPPEGYLAGVRELCDRYGIALICDEVMVGFGRLGHWFACDAWSVTPDLITFAKGVNSGYVPLGGVVIARDIADHFAARPFPGGLTYSGHPLACAVAVEHIKVIEDEQLLPRVRSLGTRLHAELTALAERHPSVGEIRGMGLMWALELVRDRESREPMVPFNATGEANQPMATITASCRDRGVWPFQHFNRLHICPPLNISDEELSHGLAAYDEALKVADEYVA